MIRVNTRSLLSGVFLVIMPSVFVHMAAPLEVQRYSPTIIISMIGLFCFGVWLRLRLALRVDWKHWALPPVARIVASGTGA